MMSTLAAFTVVSCGFLPERVSADDPRLKPFYEAIERRTDRSAMGFTPIPKASQIRDLRVEWRPRDGYSAMLHIAATTSRTVAFRRSGSGYEWLGEQETFEGPGSYDSVDGRFKESLTLTYHLPPMEGPVNELVVTYFGDESSLLRPDLSLQDVEPWLRRWGYR